MLLESPWNANIALHVRRLTKRKYQCQARPLSQIIVFQIWDRIGVPRMIRLRQVFQLSRTRCHSPTGRARIPVIEFIPSCTPGPRTHRYVLRSRSIDMQGRPRAHRPRKCVHRARDSLLCGPVVGGQCPSYILHLPNFVVTLVLKRQFTDLPSGNLQNLYRSIAGVWRTRY